MNVIVSNSSDVPLYVQIKEQIKGAILKGELEDGELLPSIRNFANDVQVSVLTIRRVYEELEKNRICKRLFIMQNCLTLQRTIYMQCWIFYIRRINHG